MPIFQKFDREMKPCPGCGRNDNLSIQKPGYCVVAIVCDANEDGCGWRGPAIASDQYADALRGAVEEWNKRTPQ